MPAARRDFGHADCLHFFLDLCASAAPRRYAGPYYFCRRQGHQLFDEADGDAVDDALYF